MGRKHSRTRKHVLFLVAGLIFLFLAGCASLGKIWEQMNREGPSPEEKSFSLEEGMAAEAKKKDDLARTHLLKGKKFFIQGDYEGAIREYQKVVTLMQKTPPADEALFTMGLIQAYSENPKKDTNKSIDFMKRVVKEYPRSPFVLPANSWIGVLQANEKLAADHEKLIKNTEKLNKDHEKIIKDNEKLTKMLEEYKRVDIETEGKKRERGR